MQIKDLKSQLRNSDLFRTIYAKFRSSGNSIKLKGKDNSIDRSQAILKSCNIYVEGNQNKICIDRGAYLQEVKIHLKGDNLKLNIGRSVFIGNGSILWMENSKSLLDIGEYSSLEKVGIAVAEGKNVMIGKDCMFSYKIDIRCSDSHGIFDLDTKSRINPAADILIGDHVWIGAKSMILKGANIGSGAVIGAGSIVTKNVENNSIAAGIPTRILKRNIAWDRSRAHTLLDS